MVHKSIDYYMGLSLEKLEIEVSNLSKEMMEIAQNIQEGNVKESYGNRLYFRASKLHGQLYQMLERRLANQYNKFLVNYAKS